VSQGTPAGPVGLTELTQSVRRREQRAWYWYDWANSAYFTTVTTVLMGPYLSTVAEQAACGRVGTPGRPCSTNLEVLGFLGISPGSLFFYVMTVSTLLSAIVLPVVGAAADRSRHKKNIMANFAWVGSLAAAGMFFVAGTNWQLGVLLLFVANLCVGSSLVVYDAILCEIATPDERDRVSSRGWAFGYLGGGLLLAINLVVVLMHGTFGLDKAMAVRLSLVSAGVWWGAFTLVPFLGIRNRAPVAVVPEQGSLVRQSFGQLFETLKDMRNYPVTMTFLVAYLFFNDGIQTVITSASVYGDKQLGFGTSVLIATILMVQFVAFGGALLFGKLAERTGSQKVILGGLVIWMVIVSVAYFLPTGRVVPFLLLAAGIGIVLGGTQALSRSFFSQLIPRGREAEYFSLYQACERGTSWLGTLVFGVVHQWTGSYRPAIFALIMFFLVGGALLAKVNPEQGIREAGNTPPVVV
jgi:UMF1 family MFS transporter